MERFAARAIWAASPARPSLMSITQRMPCSARTAAASKRARGCRKRRTRSGKRSSPGLEGQQAAAGQSQRSGGVEALSGPGRAAAREAVALPLAHCEEIQRESFGARDVPPSQPAAMPLQGRVKAAVDSVDGGFGHGCGQSQIDKQADGPGVRRGQIAEGDLDGPLPDGFGCRAMPVRK